MLAIAEIKRDLPLAYQVKAGDTMEFVKSDPQDPDFVLLRNERVGCIWVRRSYYVGIIDPFYHLWEGGS